MCADAAEQAFQVTELARQYGQPEGALAIGVADAETAPALENGLRSAGLAGFNPEGQPRRREGLYTLLSALAALVREPAFETAQALARCPDFMAWLEMRAGEKFSPGAVRSDFGLPS